MKLAIEFVRTDRELAALADALRDLSAFGIDTEFVRTRTYHANLGIVQIWDGTTCFIIEPDTLTNWRPLSDLIEADVPTKVLHSGSEDLDVFSHHLNAQASGLFDTQIAGALTGAGGLLGYQALVQQLLGVALEKGETRSNWLQRPLTDSQLHYAALDVFYLLDLHALLAERLESEGRSAWANEEFSALAARSQSNADPLLYYGRFGKRWQLSGQQRWLLLALCRWREEAAQRRDKPRNWIADDKSLFTIAEAMPSSAEEVRQLLDLSPKAVRALAPKWISLAEQAGRAAADDFPPSGHRPLSKPQRERYKEIKAAFSDVAESLSIPADILATRKDMESVVRSEPNWSPRLTGWRKQVLTEPLDSLLGADPA